MYSCIKPSDAERVFAEYCSMGPKDILPLGQSMAQCQVASMPLSEPMITQFASMCDAQNQMDEKEVLWVCSYPVLALCLGFSWLLSFYPSDRINTNSIMLPQHKFWGPKLPRMSFKQTTSSFVVNNNPTIHMICGEQRTILYMACENQLGSDSQSIMSLERSVRDVWMHKVRNDQLNAICFVGQEWSTRHAQIINTYS